MGTNYADFCTLDQCPLQCSLYRGDVRQQTGQNNLTSRCEEASVYSHAVACIMGPWAEHPRVSTMEKGYT
jgi:hypothetical protein